MRIIIDIQGCQSEGSRGRGIGRYSLSLIKSLISNFPDNVYILFANASLIDIQSEFREELVDNKYKVFYFKWYSPGPFNDDINRIDSNSMIAVKMRSYAASILNGDLILITSFFESQYDNCITEFDTSFDLPKNVSILYDLIPLINKDVYLSSSNIRTHYYDQLSKLVKFDALLTISKSCLFEAQKHLKIDSNSLYNISSACDEKLFKIDKDLSDDCSINILGLGQYLFYAGAADPRKNLKNLVIAYSKLPKTLILKHRLVFAGKILDIERDWLKEWMFEYNLPSEYVTILGYVSDAELLRLYQSCYLFIYPSFHEGFGLPVLEAMTCGAPVIASNTSSIPEVVNNNNALFNPYDVEEITNIILKCLQDKEFYYKLKAQSLENSKIFSWDKTSKLAMQAFNEILIDNSRLASSIKKFRGSNRFEKQFNKISEEILILVRNKKNKFNKKYLMYISSCIDLMQKQAKNSLNNNNLSKSNFNWLIEGPYDSNYSLSIVNRELALALDKTQVNLYLNSSEGRGDYIPDSSFLKRHYSLNSIHKKVRINNSSKLVVSRNLYPPRVSDMDGDINLLHAYGWEESEYPFNWIEEFNYFLDGITVMSEYVKKTLIDNGLCLPIKVSHLGVDHIKSCNDTNGFKINAKKFKFLHVSSCFPRKGISQLIKSYGENFTIDDDVSLIIKTFKNPHNNLTEILDQARASMPDYPHVLIIDDDLSDVDIKKLYQDSDVLVSPSCGEGFGLPIAEAMLVQLPVITTGWGGQIDFCNDNNAWLIDYEFNYSASHFGLFDSIWAEPSISHLGFMMKNLYTLNSDQIEKKTNLAKEYIDNFTWQNVAKENIDFAHNIQSYKSLIPRIACITTWNSKCGIASYSKHLIDNMSEEVLILASNEETLIQTDCDNVIRCWDYDSNLQGVLEPIIKNKITSVIIQFNFGFYNFDELQILIDELYKLGIKIIIILHSTKDHFNINDKKLSLLKPALLKCDRILVHTPDDLNKLKEFDLVENVSLFPHGILDYDYHKTTNNHLLRKSTDKTFSLSTFGFCLPNKGFINLVEAISLIHEAGFKVHLNLYTSLYDSSSSTDYYEELVKVISESLVSEYINLNTLYLEEEKILSKLSNSDLIVFPYEDSNESSSASVRHGLATATPVAVTKSSIFDDVRDCVYTLPGSTSTLLAKGIIDFLDQNLFDEFSTSAIILSWKNVHRFSKLGRRLFGMIKGIEVNDRSTVSN